MILLFINYEADDLNANFFFCNSSCFIQSLEKKAYNKQNLKWKWKIKVTKENYDFEKTLF